MMQNLLSEFSQFVTNPAGYLSNRGANIPAQYMQNPQDAIQYLMNSGKLTQADYNRLQQQAKQIQNMPMFRNMFK